MVKMLVRNRVKDYHHWRQIFDEEEAPGSAIGLSLVDLWRDIDDPNNVFFMFEVADVERARAFLADPRSAEVGETAGVIDGEFNFIEQAL
jgi:hypothetical protein